MIWVEKTPDHLQSLDLIQTFVPDNKIIHIIRDGGDTIASLFKGTQQWGKEFSNFHGFAATQGALRPGFQYLGGGVEIGRGVRKTWNPAIKML